MDKLKKLYTDALDFIGEVPDISKDWRWLTLSSLGIYVVVLAYRLSFASRWDNPDYWVNGERILSTHDSYFWLAKAKGVGVLYNYTLAEMAAFVHNTLGIGWGTIGFWSPAIVSALVGVVCFLWGWLLAGRYGGVLAGLVGGLTPGFFYRSQLGYFDTDMFTLLGPLFVSLLLAYWLYFHVRRGWFPSLGADDERTISPWVAVSIGLLIRLTGMPHTDIIRFNVLLLFLSIAVLLVIGKQGKRLFGIYGLCIVILAAFPGTLYGKLTLWPAELIFTRLGTDIRPVEAFLGFGCASVFALVLTRSTGNVRRAILNPWFGVVVFLAVVLSTNIALHPVVGSIKKFFLYFFQANEAIAAPGESISRGPVYPGVVQSIVEAQLAPLSEVLRRGLFEVWLAPLALLGMAVVVALRPIGVMLLPMVFLLLASTQLGYRFTMFGGAALCVFLSVSVYWAVDYAVRKLERRNMIAMVAQVVMAGGILTMGYIHYLALPVTPVITKAYAEGLTELGKKVPGDSRVWTWWDWGYAAQYYSGLETVADGGLHSAQYLYPLAFTLSTDSPFKANRMVVYSAQYPKKPEEWIGLEPANEWTQVPRGELKDYLDKALAKDYPAAPNQYIAVTWKDLKLSQWISHFGNLDLETGKTRESSLALFNGSEIGFSIQQGAVRNPQGQTGLVKNITIVDDGIATSRSYYKNLLSPRLMPRQPNLVVNIVASQALLMDDLAHQSMATRLFTGDPDDPEISTHFKLVVDKLPYVRIYEVIQ